MASFRKRGKVWYYRWTDGNGAKHERRGCTDRRATESLAAAAEAEAAQVRAGLIDTRGLARLAHEARPIADHLTDWQAALEARGGTAKHASVSARRVRRLAGLAGVARIGDLSLSPILAALAALRAAGLSQETINHHVRAVKAFSRWLWRDGRAADHRLAHLSTSSSESDRRRVRRALTALEAARLVAAAESGPEIQGVTGPDRAMLYRVALATGFRAGELASLTPESFRLDARPPAIVCEAAQTKNGRRAEQPIPAALARLLGPFLAHRPVGSPVFAVPDRTADMIRADLVAAGIAYETDSGVVDFHALRATYITELVRGGASVKTCQVLARHSTPILTIGLYARASLHDLAGAVESLPDLAHHLPTGVDGIRGKSTRIGRRGA
jgi:integrase